MEHVSDGCISALISGVETILYLVSGWALSASGSSGSTVRVYELRLLITADTL